MRRDLLMVENSHEKRQSLLIGLGLAAAVLAAYAPVWHCGFVGYDDPLYVTANPALRQGVSWAGLRWAFTNEQVALWHPLTWISLLLDFQIYGVNAMGMHATSLFLHLANSLFLFALLRRVTNALWPSALTAALFALHPLHVESVAWIAERKDVLSTFFWMLTVWFYVRYAESSFAGDGGTGKQKIFYVLALVFFAMGLMSKPMVVTLPFILLLLDYWPLKRMGSGEWGVEERQSGDCRMENAKNGEKRRRGVLFWRLVMEKVPFFALAAGSCVITMRFARDTGALLPLRALTLRTRLGYIPVAYVRYMAKTFWPVHLNFFYPYPAQLPFWQIAGATAVLLGITGWALARARTRPWLIVGWLWYLGALTPAIGLVQDSNAAMSDHYTYIPIVGLLVMVVWSAQEWSRAWPARTAVWLGGAAVAFCLVLTPMQVDCWRNDTALYTHAMNVSENNYLAYYNLGCDRAAEGDIPDAINLFQKAIDCSSAVIVPQPDEAFANLGIALAKEGRLDEAAARYRQALAITPNNAYAQNGLGRVLENQNKWDEAAACYAAAIAVKPDFAEGYENLGYVRALQQRFPEAEEQFAQALRLQPDSAPIHFDFGNTLLRENKLREAADQYAAVLRLRPDDLQANLNLAVVFTQLGQTADAVAHYRAAVRLSPKDVPLLKKLAWMLATDPDAKIRDGSEAVQLATQATQLAPMDAAAWDTQAAALAEAGQFPAAIAAATKALDLATTGQKDLVPKIQERLKLYEAGTPYRER